MIKVTQPVIHLLFVQGFDGGLPANFLLKVYNAEKMEIKSQMTAQVPIFSLSNLDPGEAVKLHIHAVNSEGRSGPVILTQRVLNHQKQHVEGVIDSSVALKDTMSP